MPVISGGVVGQPGQILFQEATFIETSGAGTYTASITIPAGSYLVDVLVHGTAVWDNAGTVGMIVGDVANTDGMFIVTSLKAAGDLIAGETLGMGTALDGGETGDDVSSGSWARRYLATERVISGVITTSSTGGSAGRTRMIVLYTDPTSSPIVATKA